jgi:hypothetical protein
MSKKVNPHFQLDYEDWKWFKINCMKEDKSATDVLRDFIKKYNKDNEEKE